MLRKCGGELGGGSSGGSSGGSGGSVEPRKLPRWWGAEGENTYVALSQRRIIAFDNQVKDSLRIHNALVIRIMQDNLVSKKKRRQCIKGQVSVEKDTQQKVIFLVYVSG
ncbi:hypothetical protein K0M31_015944 [Melipona bicolor]|uniref:Uncharacterized protein n=1 Tax=Melipona bicolor TaxID=60889 RepID=A0AA40G640_9HYME|nr:hypothetical protein K0M31_015944 [Melipona bicolor]